MEVAVAESPGALYTGPVGERASRDLRQGSVERNLVRMSGPMVWAVLAIMSMNLADLYFVGMLGTAPVAALGFAFPVILALTSLGVGLSAGAASVVSRSIGADHVERAKRYASDSLILTAVVAVALGAGGAALAEPLFSLLGAEPEVLRHLVPYMHVWLGGFALTAFPIVVSALLRAVGNAFVPSLILVAGAVVNVALDPVLIFGWGPVPRLGMVGAAWATLIARGLTAAVMLVALRRELGLRRPASPGERSTWQRWWDVGRIALPAAGSSMANPVGLTVVTALVGRFGTEPVAAFGIATRIESFAVVPLLALSAGIGPVVGQNWGGRRLSRVRRALLSSFGFSIAWGLVLGIALWIAGTLVSSVFADAEAVIELSARYLHIVPVTLGGYGAVILGAAAFNAANRPLPGFLLSLLRLAALYVPLAFAGAALFDLTGVFAAAAVANVLGGAVALVWTLRGLGSGEVADFGEKKA